jgi:site-specific DNA recombinase
LENRGWKNKTWSTKKGVVKGGKTFDKGSLYGLLTNPIYIGKVKHKANLYDGEHESIVDPELFQRVQKLLQRNGRNGGVEVRNRYGALLKGLLQCKACGRTMTHTFTSRGAKRYRYYTCTNAIQSGRQKCPSGSLPAAEMERIVVGHIREISTDAGLRDAVLQQARAHVDEELKALKTEQRQLQQQLARQHAEVRKLAVDSQANSTARIADLHDQITQAENRLEHLRALIDDVSANRISNDDVGAAFADFDNLWESFSPREQADLLSLLIAAVEFDVRASTVSVTFHDAGIKSLSQSKPGEAA